MRATACIWAAVASRIDKGRSTGEKVDYFKCFSDNYANGVTALAALGALILASITLRFVVREYVTKYRPYVVPVVAVMPVVNSSTFGVGLFPQNIGSYPCEFRISAISLNIGDERHGTPDFREWALLATANVQVVYPIGHVNENGIQSVRQGRYNMNRIEVEFTLHTRSIEKRYEIARNFRYEINVQGDTPVVVTRPEWQTTAA
jgi:hypothetical protein